MNHVTDRQTTATDATLFQ